MTGTATADVRDRVIAVLGRYFADSEFGVSSVTGGYAAIVIAAYGQHGRERLAQYAATLQEARFIVADHRERGHLYVREPGPGHDAAMTREIAGICLTGYNEHVHLHGAAGASAARSLDPGTGSFTVEREGREYDVIVVPRAQ